MSTFVTNEVENRSIEELEELKGLLQSQGLYSFALDIEYIIGDRIMADIKSGTSQPLPESSTSSIFSQAQAVVKKKHGAF